MLLRDLIREYAMGLTKQETAPAAPARPVPANHTCPVCHTENPRAVVVQEAMTCPACGAYFRMNARERITQIFDAGSFQELDASLSSVDFLNFPGYAEKPGKGKKGDRRTGRGHLRHRHHRRRTVRLLCDGLQLYHGLHGLRRGGKDHASV